MDAELAIRKRKIIEDSLPEGKRQRLNHNDLREDTDESDGESSDEGNEIAATPTTLPSDAGSSKPTPACRTNHLPCPFPGCTKSFNRPARLEEHKRSHTNERIFKCTFSGCDKDFLRNTHLKRHIASAHTETKTYLCTWPDCDKGFSTAQRLKKHLDLHQGREKYRCRIDDCDQVFRKHSTLDKHQRTVHEGKDAFPCDETNDDGSTCLKGFDTAYALKLHKGRLHGARSYWCTICPPVKQEGADSEPPRNLGFGTYSELQAHNDIFHPPTCGVCGHEALSQKELKAHISKAHTAPATSSEVYVCPHGSCNGKTFSRKNNLNTHLKTVHDPARSSFVCGDLPPDQLNNIRGWTSEDACGRSFKNKNGLEEHIRTAHLGMDNSTVARLKKLGTYVPPDPEKKGKNKKKGGATMVGKLTGTAYDEDERRKIPCAVVGCAFKFTRQYDLELHLKSKHGMGPEEVQGLLKSRRGGEGSMSVLANTARKAIGALGGREGGWETSLEAAARAGGPFWVGGGDSGFRDEMGDFDSFGVWVEDLAWDDEAREMFGLIDDDVPEGGGRDNKDKHMANSDAVMDEEGDLVMGGDEAIDPMLL